MARSNLSQNHWAMKLGLSRGHWSDIVNGKHPYPSVKTRERILEVFKVDLAELFETEAGGWSDHHFQAAISDRYLIDRELGHGGMGTVYVARDVKLGRLVALKVVSPEAVSGIGIKQFLKEIRYSARLDHHHILPLHDAGEAGGYPYYVMPYVRGGSLRDLLNRKQRLAVAEATTIVGGVAAALSYAHENHVLHCDVKPANVLLSGEHAFVADFGISRAIHAEAFEWGKPTALDTSAGTPAYVSPEQAGGESDLDARSDVYSLACMTFEVLAGRAPFSGNNTMAVVAQRFTAEVPDLKRLAPDVPARVADTVKRGMSLDLERRPQSVFPGRVTTLCLSLPGDRALSVRYQAHPRFTGVGERTPDARIDQAGRHIRLSDFHTRSRVCRHRGIDAGVRDSCQRVGVQPHESVLPAAASFR
jgi:serine/threonine-protein kinase